MIMEKSAQVVTDLEPLKKLEIQMQTLDSYFMKVCQKFSTWKNLHFG